MRLLDAFIFIDRALAFWSFFREALRFKFLYLCPWWQDEYINGNIQQQIFPSLNTLRFCKRHRKAPFCFLLGVCTLHSQEGTKSKKKKTSPLTAASSYGIFAPFNFPLNASLKPGLTYNLQSSWQFVHNHFLGLCCRYVQWRGDLGERQSPKPQVWFVQNHARARGSTDYFRGRWWHKKAAHYYVSFYTC